MLGKPKRDTEISQSSGPIPLLEAEHDNSAMIQYYGWAEAHNYGIEAASKHLKIYLPHSYNTLGSGEDIMKLKELMELYTKLPERLLEVGEGGQQFLQIFPSTTTQPSTSRPQKKQSRRKQGRTVVLQSLSLMRLLMRSVTSRRFSEFIKHKSYS
ncbi:hypothetical protein Tco_0804200 [Tanacetum coccineum]|uniref:Uncharacterized protein n=1 Tax=Tanacetum coccineum TaxID=301880 RepID=A0ABQ5A4L8_9ASTR